MLKKIKLENILFLDIETVPLFAKYSEIDENAKLLWEQKTNYQRKDEFTPEEFYDRAGIWAEFGKISLYIGWTFCFYRRYSKF